MKLSKKFSNLFFLGIKLDGVNLLYSKCHAINFKRGGSYISFADWIKKKKNHNKIEKQRY